MNFNSSSGLMRSGNRNMTMGFGLRVLDGGSFHSGTRDMSPKGKLSNYDHTMENSSKQEKDLILNHRSYTDKEGEEM
jgi:hypothetical protein